MAFDIPCPVCCEIMQRAADPSQAHIVFEACAAGHGVLEQGPSPADGHGGHDELVFVDQAMRSQLRDQAAAPEYDQVGGPVLQLPDRAGEIVLDRTGIGPIALGKLREKTTLDPAFMRSATTGIILAAIGVGQKTLGRDRIAVLWGVGPEFRVFGRLVPG